MLNGWSNLGTDLGDKPNPSKRLLFALFPLLRKHPLLILLYHSHVGPLPKGKKNSTLLSLNRAKIHHYGKKMIRVDTLIKHFPNLVKPRLPYYSLMQYDCAGSKQRIYRNILQLY